MVPRRRHAYDAKKTLVMCVSGATWRDEYARDGDEEARRRCPDLTTRASSEGDYLRAVSDDDATELWALVARSRWSVELEKLAQYKARFFPGDDDFELGGFACSTDSDAEERAAAYGCSSTIVVIEGHPLYGCVEVTYFDIDRLMDKYDEDGKSETASNSSDGTSRRDRRPSPSMWRRLCYLDKFAEDFAARKKANTSRSR